MNALTITTRDAETGPVLHLAGHLDHTTAEQLRTLVADLPLERGQLLVLHMGELEFCDSSGLTALIAARNHAHAAHADVALAAVPALTLRTMRLIGLDQLFTPPPDPDPV